MNENEYYSIMWWLGRLLRELLQGNFKFGFRYRDGKINVFRLVEAGNPKPVFRDTPDWAVDIREIIAMIFAGTLGIVFACVGEYSRAETIGVGLMMYATGRTVSSKK